MNQETAIYTVQTKIDKCNQDTEAISKKLEKTKIQLDMITDECEEKQKIVYALGQEYEQYNIKDKTSYQHASETNKKAEN